MTPAVNRRRWSRRVALSLGGLVLATIAALGAAFARVAHVDLRSPPVRSVRFLDRNGELLRSLPIDERLRGRWLETRELPALVRELTVLAEDRRFRWHPGVDPLALVRAGWQNLVAGRTVSGGSTLTTQIVRLLHPRPRTLAAKLAEAQDALALDALWSKDDQLTLYLNAAPYGHGLTGIAEASDAYFGKPPEALSPLEAALLVVAPRAPTVLNPARGGEASRRRALALLERAVEAGVVTPEALVLARSAAPEIGVPSFPSAELHATERARLWLLDHPDLGPAAEVSTTLDARLQHTLARILRRHLALPELQRHHANGAVVVLAAGSSDVLGYAGSVDYFDAARKGANDGVAAPRQPGSTLKPFLYELALERGYTLASALLDVPTDVSTPQGAYAPVNFGHSFAGPVRLRLALANSLNVPAARTLDEVGVEPFLQRLRALGLALPLEASHYGLGLALGNGEVALLDLAAAYAALVNGGLARGPRLVSGVTRSDGHRTDLPPDPGAPVVEPGAAWLIADALSDDQARAFEFGASKALDLPFRVALKTGTSADFRDSLAVGATPEHVVAVWVGSFDREPLPGTAGAAGAGPILHDVLTVLYGDREPRWAEPPTLVRATICALSGARPGPDCASTTTELFLPGTEPTTTCRLHVRVRVDLANGLRAGPACPADETEERALLDLPADARDWGRQAGLPLAPTAWSPRCSEGASPGASPPFPPLPIGRGGPEVARGEELRLVHPVSGSIYYLDPGMPPDHRVLLARVHDPVGRRLTWSLDGAALATLPPTEPCRVPLTEGPHSLTVRPVGGHDLVESTFDVRR